MKKVLNSFGRSLVIGIAGLFILLSVGGIVGAWYVNREAVHVTLSVFSVVESGVSVADSGVGQALSRVRDARSEIALTEQDIAIISQNLKENHPGLVALSERLDTRLAPTAGKLQSSLEPVQERLAGVDAVLRVANSLPYFQEKAPGLQTLQDALQNLAGLGADLRQLRTTIQAAAEGKADALTDETAALLLNIAQRADERLVRIQSSLEALQNQINDLQARLVLKKARILFLLNLFAALISLLFLWIIYSQVVVIQVQLKKIRRLERHEAASVPVEMTVDMTSPQDDSLQAGEGIPPIAQDAQPVDGLDDRSSALGENPDGAEDTRGADQPPAGDFGPSDAS